MLNPRPNRIIIDTNLWISFLIGKELGNLKDLIVNNKIKLITCDQLITEIELVTSREKFRRYFREDKIIELIIFLKTISERINIQKVEKLCRDPKDDFLLTLAKTSKAHYLITSDKDLLVIGVHTRTKIVSISEFKKLLNF